MLSFSAYLAKQNITYSTIKVYISAICNLHVASGQHRHFTDQLTPHLEQVLRGIKKEQSYWFPTKIRLPITIQIMHRSRNFYCKLLTIIKVRILMWAVCCASFFGFLRCSEFTVPKAQDYDSNVHLIYADVAVDCKENPQILQLYIKQSKTDLRIQKGYEAIIRKNQLCSVPR